jgi:hypothetical protein
LFTGDNWLAIYCLFAKRLSQFGVRKKKIEVCPPSNFFLRPPLLP